MDAGRNMILQIGHRFQESCRFCPLKNHAVSCNLCPKYNGWKLFLVYHLESCIRNQRFRDTDTFRCLVVFQ